MTIGGMFFFYLKDIFGKENLFVFSLGENTKNTQHSLPFPPFPPNVAVAA